MHTRLVPLVGMWLLLAAHPALSEVIHVPGDHSTIQAAINAAAEGDEVVVAPGTYNENIHFHGVDITLRSTDPASAEIVAATVIDGVSGPVVWFQGGESPACLLTGFTITGGQYSGTGYGGGIQGFGASPTVVGNAVVENQASGFAGGIYDCDGLVRGNLISANLVEPFVMVPFAFASAVGIGACDGVVDTNVICNNEVNTTESPEPCIVSGVGLSGGAGIIQNNFIFNNVVIGSGAERGIGVSGVSGIFRNNTVWGNPTSYGSSLMYHCLGQIENCIIGTPSGSEAHLFDECSIPEFCCLPGWTGGGAGNISDNPQFVDAGNGDFHLLPTSPCIDAGRQVESPRVDFEGDLRGFDGSPDPRGDGSDFDIGADEFFIGDSGQMILDHLLALAELTGTLRTTADVNSDEAVDIADFVLLQALALPPSPEL